MSGGDESGTVIVVVLALVFLGSCSSGHVELPLYPATPVYNAVFTPTFSNTPAVLIDGKPTSVRFFIGPNDSASAVDAKNWTVNPEVITSREDAPLIVAMVCSFCSELHTQNHPITYLAAKRSSTEARFDFVPSRKKLQGTSGLGRIAFNITRRGVQTDYVVINVRVVLSGSTQTENLTVEQPTLLKPARLMQPTWSRDVDLVLGIRQDGNRLQVQLIPGNDGVAKLFGGKHLTKDGEFRSFNTGMLKDDVQRANASLYSDLYAAINKDTALKLQLTGASSLPQAPQSDILLTPADEKVLLKPFYDAGVNLYRELFVTGAEADLRELMENFRKYAPPAGYIPRVRIQTQGIYLPFQVLISSASDDPREFWGFKYELSIDPTGIELGGPYSGPLTYNGGPLMFGQYRGSDANDIVANLGHKEATYLASDLKIKGVLVADSHDSFFKQLEQSRNSIQMIVTFTHGISGTIIKDSGEVSEFIGGPRLKFGESDFVPASELNKLPSMLSLPAAEISVFSNAPIVFLNGCETGVAGFYPTTNLDFAGTFLRLGSRGVIVTEAPVWTYFGYNFGISLLKQMKNGDPLPSVMLNTRRQYLGTLNNPLGLLYTYYGGPDVTVRFQ